MIYFFLFRLFLFTILVYFAFGETGIATSILFIFSFIGSELQAFRFTVVNEIEAMEKGLTNR